MPKISPTRSSFVVKNISNKTIKVFGKIPVKRGDSVDLFKGMDGLSEITVLDALRSPDGVLYKDIYINNTLILKSYNLLLLNNLHVNLSNIVSTNKAESGQVLSVNDHNKLEWIYGDVAARLQYEAPLKQNGEVVSLPKADAQTSGYLHREDWLLFKGKSKGLRVWQYQDFEGPFTNPISLYSFENGEGLGFNKNLIVDGTAVAVDVSNNNKPPRVLSGVLKHTSKKIEVNQHIRENVFLNYLPDDNNKIRIYYLVVLPDGVNIPENYSPPTDYVRKKRIEYFDAVDIDSGGAKSIFGQKVFNDEIAIKDRASIGQDLVVDNSISCDNISIKSSANPGYVLTSDAVGDSKWCSSPIVSSTPPSYPYNGRMWVKAPEYITFVFDGLRKKWLRSDETFVVDGAKNITAGSNIYMDGHDNIPHNINSICLPYNAVLTGLMAACQNKHSWSAEVHVDGKLIGNSILHVVNSNRASNMNLDVNFKAGDKIQLFASGSDIVMPYIRANPPEQTSRMDPMNTYDLDAIREQIKEAKERANDWSQRRLQAIEKVSELQQRSNTLQKEIARLNSKK